MFISTLILGVILGFCIFNILDMVVLYTQLKRWSRLMNQTVIANVTLILAIIALWIYNYTNFK